MELCVHVDVMLANLIVYFVLNMTLKRELGD